MPVHLGFDPREDFVQEVHFGMETGIRSMFAIGLRDFPQFFPQVWKTLGRDQTCMSLERPESGVKDANCNTNQFD